jgi:hypothetical protein
LVAVAILLGGSWQFYVQALASIFFAFSLASILIIHFRIVPSWRDALLVVCGTFLLAAIDFQALHYKPTFAAWLSFAGLSSLITLGVRFLWANGANRNLLGLAFFPSVLLIGSEYFATTFLEWTAAAHPKVLDLYLYSFDASLGLQFPFLVGQRFALWPWLRWIGTLFYIGLPIPIALVYAGRTVRLREKARPSFVAFLGTGPVGVLFYNLFPALGPAHLLLRNFPWHPLATGSVSRLLVEPVPIQGAPNAIPSLHMAWVLLAWWYSRGLSRGERTIAFTFTLFTVLATLGTGEHYVVDLVVALPFALLMESLCSWAVSWKDRLRLATSVAGLLSILGWFALLRYATHLFWVSFFVPWLLCAGTVALCFVLERKLYHHVERASAKTLSPLALWSIELAARIETLPEPPPSTDRREAPSK